MSFFFVDPEIYEKHKDDVLALSQSIQVNYPEHLPPDQRSPALSDRQIAERLGLDERTVREIRCVGEREYYDIEEYDRAAIFKETQCRAYAEKGLSGITAKYVERARAAKKD